MPWSASDAPRFNKKTEGNEELKKAWAKAANAALEEYDGDESKAIATANATVDKMSKKGRAAAPDNYFTREASLKLSTPASFNSDTRECEAILSTGASVRRRDFFDGTEFDEILDMGPKAIRLDRLNAGAAILDSHRHFDGIDAVLGGIVPGSARIEKGNLLARMKFSRASQLAQRVTRDLQDGIQFPLSVGYRVHKSIDNRETSPMTRTIADWEPMEVSLVAIPAEGMGTGIRGEFPQRHTAVSQEKKTMTTLLVRQNGETDSALLVRIGEHEKKTNPIENETPEAFNQRCAEHFERIGTAEAQLEAERAEEKRKSDEINGAYARAQAAKLNGGNELTPKQRAETFKDIIAIGRQAEMTIDDIERASVNARGEMITVEEFRAVAFQHLVKKQNEQPPIKGANAGTQERSNAGDYGSVTTGENPAVGKAEAMAEALSMRILASRRVPAIVSEAQREWCKNRELTDQVGLAMRVIDGKDQPKNLQARNYLQHSIVELAAECIGYKFSGYGMRAGSREKALDLVARAWHSTTDFPGIFANALNKSLLARYQVAMPTYREIAAERTFQDFRPHPQVRAGDYPQPQPLTESGELRYGTAGESNESVSVKPYGVVFAISRQMLVNDDMGAIDQILGSTGTGVLRFENEQFFNMMLQNTGVGPALLQDGLNVFDATATAAGHNNYIATFALGGGPPSVTTLSTARAALRKMKSINGQILNVNPSILLTGALNETAAAQMVTTITPNISTSVNPFQAKLRPVVEALIPANTTGGGEPWYVFADPGALPCFVYGFLSGGYGPRVRTDEPFGVQGIRVSLEIDFGVGAIDYRGAFLNIGKTS